ncbi:MAG: hypothetical protein U0869_10215 [Chloroflexota bacterium]
MTAATATAHPVTRSEVPPPIPQVRRLRLTAAALQRLLRRPGRVPAAWTVPTFERRVDRTRAQLLPIRSLAALADSFGREHGTDDPAIRLAYGLRWLELQGVVEELPWRLHWPAGGRGVGQGAGLG